MEISRCGVQLVCETSPIHMQFQIATFRSLFEVPAGIDCQHHLFHNIAWSKSCCINMSSRPLNPVQVLLISYRNMNPYPSVWWPAMYMVQPWNSTPEVKQKISWGPFSYHNLSHDFQCPLRFRHRAEVLGHCPFGTLQGIHLWILIFSRFGVTAFFLNFQLEIIWNAWIYKCLKRMLCMYVYIHIHI